MLNKKEEKMLRFYEGDVEGEDPFWSDPKAYLTINSLFFKGIENEVCRTDENKRLNPFFLEDPERLMDVCVTLFEIAQKNQAEKNVSAYRVERYNDYLAMKHAGKTISFTSTSTAEFLNDYRDKRGLALLRIEIEEGTPCIDMGALLSSYLKQNESEILLIPDTTVEIEELEVTEEYKKITDMDNAPPKVYALIKVRKGSDSREEVLFDKALYEQGAESGKRVYEALNQHDYPEEEDIQKYSLFKEMFVSELKKKQKRFYFYR